MLAILFFKHSLQRQHSNISSLAFEASASEARSCKEQDIKQKWERRKGWVRYWLSNVSSAIVLSRGLKPFCFCGTSILSHINICFIRHWSLLADHVTWALKPCQRYNYTEIRYFILKYLSPLYVKNCTFKIFPVSKNLLLISDYFTAI